MPQTRTLHLTANDGTEVDVEVDASRPVTPEFLDGFWRARQATLNARKPAAPTDPAIEAIKKAQAAKYPTAAEQGAPARSITPPNYGPSPLTVAGPTQGISDLATGAVKGAVGGIPLTLARILGTVPQGTTPQDIGAAPTNLAQTVGKYGEQAAEYIAPAGAASRVTAGLSLPARMAAQGGTAAAVGLGQGQTPGEAAVTGGAAAALTAVPTVVGKAAAAYKTAKYGTPVQQIENKLLQGAGSKEAKAVVNDIAPKLASDPNLVKAASGAEFDAALADRFKQSKLGLDAAALKVPANTTVDKKPIVDAIKDGIDRLEVPTPGGPISGHDDALAVLKKELTKIDQFPDQIPFKDIQKYRVQLDDAIKSAGGFKETSSAADRAAMEAKRFVTNSIRTELANAAPVLKPANAEYSLMHKAVESAGLDFDTGRRIAEVGKPLNSKVVTALKYGAGLTATGLASKGAYDIYRILTAPTRP